MKPIKITLYLLSIVLIVSCSTTPTEKADHIYHNGNILTMVDDNKIVEAIAVKDGKILAVGDWSALQNHQGNSTQVTDLEDKTLLPGFIDGHSHFGLGMKMIANANLSSPPVDSIRNIADIIQRLKKHQTKYNLTDGQWLVGHGYDPDQLTEKRHPNIDELTAAFPDNPVFILHVSAHLCIVNQQALAKAKIDKNTPNPEGGVIVRKEGSNEPNGLLQERALYLILPLLPNPSPAQLEQLLVATQNLYASQGITTAQDGLTDLRTYQFLKQAALQGKIKLDIELLASFAEAKEFMVRKAQFGVNTNGVRLAGLKITSDGSPQGKTAFFRKPYLTHVPGCTLECRGLPTVSVEQLKKLTTMCYSNDIQLYVHANGDASIEMLLDAHKEVVDSLGIADKELRTVVIHSQFVGKDQLDRYVEYGFVPSFFTNHAFFWGDVHIENLGEERASFLSPMKTAADKGIIATNHTDFTITPINQMFLTWTAVNRTTRTGKVLGAAERLTPWEALKAITINSAYQHRTEAIKGSLEVGKLADLVILDKNPLNVVPNTIKDIKVVKTIKAGKVIFE